MTWEGTHDIEATDHIEDNAPETLLCLKHPNCFLYPGLHQSEGQQPI